ncbi:MAG: D-cysteine desulfhydrase [Thermoleophilaceae bacterium]|jgi:D-cysteine desulfhydrase|nr:D-cysteine desulfhydrase [Thermoleophilaceae bacterium]
MDAPRLHRLLPGVAAGLPYLPLGSGPTPLRELTGMPAGAAPVWLKDDGRYGQGGWGGNKVRKLEWILPDADRSGARTIVTFGAIGTNHGLATAVYGEAHGQRVVLVVVDQPMNERVAARLERLRRTASEVHVTHTKARTIAALPFLLGRLALSDRHLPYVLPVGGSSAVGAFGYVEGALELAQQVRAGQMPEPSHVVVALGSGGTVSGLALGLRLAGLKTRVVGVLVNDNMNLEPAVLARLAGRSARLLEKRGAELPAAPPSPEDITVEREFLGPGYGHVTPEAERALKLAREHEGLELEPVYTGKALAGLLALNERGAFGEGPVVFLNTHGPRDEGGS